MDIKTIRRPTLAKMLTSGKLKISRAQHCSECEYKKEENMNLPVRVYGDTESPAVGFYNIAAREFKSCYGGAYLTEEGEYHLYTAVDHYVFIAA